MTELRDSYQFSDKRWNSEPDVIKWRRINGNICEIQYMQPALYGFVLVTSSNGWCLLFLDCAFS
jgi:hypothetical protein